MEQNQNSSSRRKFFQWSVGILSSITAFKLLVPAKKKEKETVKMLTEDGRLVEVDMKQITKTGIKVPDKDIHTWIKNKPTIQ